MGKIKSRYRQGWLSLRVGLLLMTLLVCLTGCDSCQQSESIEERPGGSLDVFYSYPQGTDGISVGRNGEASLALKIPTFPAYLQPSLHAAYNSRGGDGIMGVGWDVPLPSITLNFSNERGALDRSVDRDIEVISNQAYIKERWVANPEGPLVCESQEPSAHWSSFNCFSSPRGVVKFNASGMDFAREWKSVDPVDGVTKYYGGRPATLINRFQRPTAWLLRREESREGKSIEYFYEERKGSDQRLLMAVLMAGNKTIQFVYEKRQKSVTSNFQLSTRRQNEHLLKEIRLLDGCVPVQEDDVEENIWTNFNSCDGAEIIEKVVLEYKEPGSRYTGRYVLSSWTRTSGDGRVSYRPVRFDYNGDNVSASGSSGVSHSVTSQVAQPHFPIPDGYTTVSSLGRGPFQNYIDWNRDGLADWVTTKQDDSLYMPAWNTQEHRFYVYPRNANGDFDETPLIYDDPFAGKAAWIRYPHLHTRAVDNWELNYVTTSASEISERVDDYWPEATIGVDTRPWIYTPDREGSSPISTSFTISVSCTRLGYLICEDLKNTYKRIWGNSLGREWDEKWDDLSVKLVDLQDMNGDGYLDRVVSGLIVIWDPSAPDKNQNDIRLPQDMQPAIYVSHFNPESQAFNHFQRYEVASPIGDFSQLSPLFLSALGINHHYNAKPSHSEMSAHGSVNAALNAIGTGVSAVGLSAGFLMAHEAISQNPNDAEAREALKANRAALGNLLMGTFNSAMQSSEAPPEIKQAVRYATFAVSSGQKTVAAAEKFKAIGEAETALGGWAAFSHSVIGVAGSITNYIWRERSKTLMKKPGFNGAAIAANTKTGTVIVDLVVAGAGAIFLGLAAAGAISMTPPGIVMAIVSLVIGVFFSVLSLLSAEGNFPFESGKVKYDYFPQRGAVYKNGSHLHQETVSEQILGWRDLDGSGHLDLVVSKYHADRVGFAVATGEFRRGQVVPKTSPWIAWEFSGETAPPYYLDISRNEIQFEAKEVHRGDQIDQVAALLDINGDRLADYVTVPENGGHYGLKVYLNNGRGFEKSQIWRADSASAPDSCNQSLRLSRTRNLSWAEGVGRKAGHSVNLTNVIQGVGPDLNNDGLPDLVIKDESSYESISSGGACVKNSSGNMCDDPMPVDPEPQQGENCQEHSDVWYARFDGLHTTRGHREGKSHLTPHAQDVFSPLRKGDYYVAYNTGQGFAPYVRLSEKLPSFGGNFGVSDMVNPKEKLFPEDVMQGAVNFIGDPDGQGMSHLFAMDIANPDIRRLDGTHPMAYQYRIGIPNPDALTRIQYPEGGVVSWQYALHRDVQGQQGPPLWVLERANFDDRIRRDFNLAEGWQGTLPYVEYHYSGAKLNHREFLGFEAVAETRFSGTDLTQVIQTFYQQGLERGATKCVETRGVTLANGHPVNETTSLYPICTKRLEEESQTDHPLQAAIDLYTSQVEVPQTSIDVNDYFAFESVSGQATVKGVRSYLTDHPPQFSSKLSDKEAPLRVPVGKTKVVESCLHRAQQQLQMPSLLPLLIRNEFIYRTQGSLQKSLPDGSREDVSRNFDLGETKISLFNSGFTNTWSRITVNYNGLPFKTPRLSLLTTSDGLRRSLRSTWQHDSSRWVFLKTQEEKLDRNGQVYFSKKYNYENQFPYHLIKFSEEGTGQTRSILYGDYNSGGVAQTIIEKGVEKKYSYYEDSEAGTSLLKSFEAPTDSFRPVGGVQTYKYDSLGRIVEFTDESGDIDTYEYDTLGVLQWEQKAGLERVDYLYDDIGQVNFSRDLSSLASQQRTTKIEKTFGEEIRSTTWWDGFYRKFRSGKSVSGEQTFEIDLDTKTVGTNTEVFAEDRLWFQEREAEYLLMDFRLNGGGEIQCQSLPYVNDSEPEAYSSTIYDPLRRAVLQQDFEGFSVGSFYETSQGGLQEVLSLNELGHFEKETYNGFDQRVRLDRSGLTRFKYRYNDWDKLTRIVDGNGHTRIVEVNAWGQPIKECRQPDGASLVPPVDRCPSSWPTVVSKYNDYGQKTSYTDALGEVTEYRYSYCDQVAGEIIHPAVESSPGAARPQSRVEFDPQCRQVKMVAKNGVRYERSYTPFDAVVVSKVAVGSPDEAVEEFGYDGLGRRVFTQDAEGFRSYHLKDFRHLSLLEVRPDGGRWQNSYSVWGGLEQTENPMGHEVFFKNDRMGRLLERKEERYSCDMTELNSGKFSQSLQWATERRFYDRKGRLLLQQNPDGGTNAQVFDALDRRVKWFLPDRATVGAFDLLTSWQYGFDLSGHANLTVDPDGYKTRKIHDPAGQVVRQVRQVDAIRSETVGVEYDFNGNPQKKFYPGYFDTPACVKNSRGPEAFVEETNYTPLNSMEKKWSRMDHQGQRSKREWNYNSFGQVQNYSDPSQRVISYHYNGRGAVDQQTLPNGGIEKFWRNGNGKITKKIDARGVESSWDYDSVGYVKKVQHDTGVVVHSEHNLLGQVISEGVLVDPVNQRWQGIRQHFHSDGNLGSQASAKSTQSSPPSFSDWSDLSQVRICTDSMGRALAREDELGNVSQQRYDLRGQRTESWKVPLPPNTSWEKAYYEYDRRGNLIAIRTPMGGGSGPAEIRLRREYDGIGRKILESVSTKDVVRKRNYGPAGNLCSLIDVDSSGNVRRSVEQIFDPLGRKIVEKLSTGEEKKFLYERDGSLSSISDASGKWSYEYNSLGLKKLSKQYVKAESKTYEFSFEYEPNGLLQRTNFPALGAGAPQFIEMDYEPTTNRLLAKRTDQGAIVQEVSYDGAGHVLSFKNGKGDQILSSYDDFGRLKSKTYTSGTQTLAGKEYEYDAASNFKRIVDVKDPRFSFDYTLDARNRLVSEEADVLGGMYTFHYNEQSLPERVNAPTSATGKEFFYDTKGRLKSMSLGSEIFDFTYDEFGNRINDEKSQLELKFNSLDRVTQKRKNSGEWIEVTSSYNALPVTDGDHHYVYYDSSLPGLEISKTGEITHQKLHYYFQGNLIESKKLGDESESLYFFTNHQKSPVFQTDVAGNLMLREYTAYGEPIARSLQNSLSLESVVGFQSSLSLKNSELEQMILRFFDPVSMSFISSDPMGLDSRGQAFSFAHGNPLKFTDPLGTEPCSGECTFPEVEVEGETWLEWGKRRAWENTKFSLALPFITGMFAFNMLSGYSPLGSYANAPMYEGDVYEDPGGLERTVNIVSLPVGGSIGRLALEGRVLAPIALGGGLGLVHQGSHDLDRREFSPASHYAFSGAFGSALFAVPIGLQRGGRFLWLQSSYGRMQSIHIPELMQESILTAPGLYSVNPYLIPAKGPIPAVAVDEAMQTAMVDRLMIERGFGGHILDPTWPSRSYFQNGLDRLYTNFGTPLETADDIARYGFLGSKPTAAVQAEFKVMDGFRGTPADLVKLERYLSSRTIPSQGSYGYGEYQALKILGSSSSRVTPEMRAAAEVMLNGETSITSIVFVMDETGRMYEYVMFRDWFMLR